MGRVPGIVESRITYRGAREQRDKILKESRWINKGGRCWWRHGSENEMNSLGINGEESGSREAIMFSVGRNAQRLD